MFARDILVKGSPGTSSLRDSEAHVTKTRFGSCSVSNYMDTKDSGDRGGLTPGGPVTATEPTAMCMTKGCQALSSVVLTGPELLFPPDNRACVVL